MGEPLRKRQLPVVFRLAGRKMCKLTLNTPVKRPAIDAINLENFVKFRNLVFFYFSVIFSVP